jgi:hypothetical protein
MNTLILVFILVAVVVAAFVAMNHGGGGSDTEPGGGSDNDEPSNSNFPMKANTVYVRNDKKFALQTPTGAPLQPGNHVGETIKIRGKALTQGTEVKEATIVKWTSEDFVISVPVGRRHIDIKTAIQKGERHSFTASTMSLEDVQLK